MVFLIGIALIFTLRHTIILTYALSSLSSNIKLHKVHLRPPSSSPQSPWCYALTVDPTIPATPPIKHENNEDDNINIASNFVAEEYNFLASQVWPSARVAAFTCEKYADPSWTVVEMGCGPGLPSLTMACKGMNVIATDINRLALQMVHKAASEQGFVHQSGALNMGQQRFETKRLDLTNYNESIEMMEHEFKADLYILSDVFENNHVAVGAARLTMKALELNANVWVFAQSDRAQREIYKEEIQRLISSHEYTNCSKPLNEELKWEEVDDVFGDKK